MSSSIQISFIVGNAISTDEALRNQWEQVIGGPKVAALAGGQIVYVWSAQGIDGDSLGIAARIYDALGNPITAQFRVNDHAPRTQLRPDVTALEDGGFVIVTPPLREHLSSLYSTFFVMT